jgi:flagellin-like protein
MKIFNKIFPKRRKNKRGISPVIATILLIALTVTAAAIVYFVVVPLFEGNGELVLMSSWSLTDSDNDGNFDTLEGDLINIGTKEITLEEGATVIVQESAVPSISKAYSPNNPIKTSAQTFTWDITTDLVYSINERQDTKCEAANASDQISPLTQYEIIINFGKNQLTTGIQFSEFTTAGGETPEEPEIEYLSTDLVLRTSDNDPSTSRGSFPATSGYSQRLWFLLGIYRSGKSGLCADTTDYMAADGVGNSEDYRPYIGIDDEFSTQISSHTNYKIMTYNDSGNYPGCVCYTGNSFDGADPLKWPQRGVVYMFSYIYNPTSEAMDVDISVQSDDSFMLWVNGDLELGTYSTSQWNKWVTPTTITFNPGFNIITLRTTDNGGNWDAQTLFWDTGDTDPLTSLLNVWPIIEPTSTFW